MNAISEYNIRLPIRHLVGTYIYYNIFYKYTIFEFKITIILNKILNVYFKINNN